jgi:hypothetical protein
VNHRKPDFPVFRSSLFPDYNRDNPPVLSEPTERKAASIEKNEKAQENLDKEEQLLHETDMLLARLGIELGTDLLGKSSIVPDTSDDKYDLDDYSDSVFADQNQNNETTGFKLKG